MGAVIVPMLPLLLFKYSIGDLSQQLFKHFVASEPSSAEPGEAHALQDPDPLPARAGAGSGRARRVGADRRTGNGRRRSGDGPGAEEHGRAPAVAATVPRDQRADRRTRSGRRAEAAAHGQRGHGRAAAEPAAREDVECALAARAVLRRQAGDAVHPGAEVLRHRAVRRLAGRPRQRAADQVRRRPAARRPVRPGHPGGTPGQARFGHECRPGLRRRRPVRPLCPAPGQLRLADLDHRRQQAAAAQARDHEPRRRGAAAVGEPDRLGPEAGPCELGVHLQAAQGREGHRHGARARRSKGASS